MIRFLRWVAAVATFLVCVGVAGYLYYAYYSPDRSKYPLRGIDVSRHQGTIDWPAVAKSDVAFAILKATEGGDHQDERFAANLAGAQAVGLAVGAYHFFTFCRPGAEQASNFLSAVPHDSALLPPVVDLEFAGNCSTRPTVADLKRELSDFLTPVEAAFGRPAILYVVDDAAAMYAGALPDRPRWIRSIIWAPVNSDWVYWQYHSAGHVAGIEGEVDLNVLQGGPDALQRLRART